MPDDCPALKAANDSRRRAWREMQRLRRLLALVAGELPAAPKPPNFEAEGAILRRAVVGAFCLLLRQLDKLERAVARLRPYLNEPNKDRGYPNALVSLNQATDRPRVKEPVIWELLFEIDPLPKHAPEDSAPGPELASVLPMSRSVRKRR